jgi:hypothetical protein
MNFMPKKNHENVYFERSLPTVYGSFSVKKKEKMFKN